MKLRNSYDLTKVQLRKALFVEAVGCEIMYFESLTGGGIYGNFSAMGHLGPRMHGYFCKH